MSYASTVLQRKFGLGQQYDPNALAYFSAAGITPASATPTAYDQAATFNGSNQYLSVASNSSLFGSNGFTIAGWFYAKSISAETTIIGKWASGISGYDYIVSLETNNSVSFYTHNSTYVGCITSANAFPLNQWFYLVCWYDKSANTSNVQINNGSITSVSNTDGVNNGSQPFVIGARVDGASSSYLNGNIAGVGFWQRTLTSTQRTTLYNNGIGLTYSAIENTDLAPTIVSYWALNETSGASVYVDSNEVNNLTPYNTPTNSVGPIATATASSQSLINTFVKGIKNLGLWNNFVCWPLRSSQNASSTQTAYSLGGLGSYSGNLVNNPAWASNGMLFNGNNKISTSLNQNGATTSTTLCILNSLVSNFQSVVSIGDTAPSKLNEIGVGYITPTFVAGFGYGGDVVANGNYQNSFNSIAFSEYPSNQNLYNNSSLLATGSASITLGSYALSIGTRINGGNNFTGTIALAGYLNYPFNASNNLNQLFYSLYKSTLGVGLSLP
jgi:hypothetical protein